jgi:hypothetical protein
MFPWHAVYTDINFDPPRAKPPKFSDFKPEPAEKPLPFETKSESGMCPRELSAFLASYNRPATKSAASVSDFDADVIRDRAPVTTLIEKRAPETKKFRIVKGATATTVYDEAGEVIAIYVGGCDEAVLEQYQ